MTIQFSIRIPAVQHPLRDRENLIACAQTFSEYYSCCMTLSAIKCSLLQRTRQRRGSHALRLQRRLPMLLNGSDNPKIALFPRGICTPSNTWFRKPNRARSGPPSTTWYPRPTQVIKPNDISIGSAVFVWIPNAMLYNTLSMVKKTPKLPIPLSIALPQRRRTKPRR